MTRAVEDVALALAVANVLFLVVLVVRRMLVSRRKRRHDEIRRRVQPYALRLVEGQRPPTLAAEAQVVLAQVLARYARLVRGEARSNIGAYFAGSDAYARQIAALRSRRDWRRAAAAFTLGDMAVQAAVPHLLEALEDSNGSVRAAAARSLGSLAAEEAVEPVVGQLAGRRLPQLVAANALLAIGPPAVERLRELLRHPDPAARATAVELLGLVGGVADAQALSTAVLDPEPAVREPAARALGRVGARGSVEVLRTALHDTHDAVREAAARSLGEIGDRAALPDLLAVAETGSFEPARAAAAAAAAIDRDAAAHGHGEHLREVSELAAL